MLTFVATKVVDAAISLAKDVLKGKIEERNRKKLEIKPKHVFV